MNYDELVAALRSASTVSTAWEKLMMDAADAIEALQAQFPKRGEWVEENRRPRSSQFVCSECHRTAYDPQPPRGTGWRNRQW